MTLPTMYDLAAFDGTILYPKALRDRHQCTSGDVCHVCLKAMSAGYLPENSLANFQYYAYDELPPDVAVAFRRASLFNLWWPERRRRRSVICSITK